ncbi:Methyl-accepting chemotaxis protein [hydrothermal vent metagenome]|uniref:Methyl-accepting chemotaxis protein n=1 Tax=hydrothermal vent metagenome TaxID=652676 RepID=A0A3B1B9P0_9ZZZZ
MRQHQFVCAITVSILLSIPLIPFAAYPATDQEFAVILNLSGKQRMLTQKMSKEILLVASGVDASANKANLKKTADLFDKTLKGLIAGDADLGLVAAENKKIVKQLKKVQGLWGSFRKNVDAVLGGDTSKPVLEKVAKENLPLLKNMNRCVKMFENDAKKGGGAKMGAGMATVINLAGKQRMLTQKMTKELLLVANGINADKNKLNLKKTASLFDRTLKGLLDGDKDLELPGTHDDAIRAQLATVAKLWQGYKPLVDKVVASSSNDVSPVDLGVAAKVNLPLLKNMNKAVGMYQKSVK